MGAHAEDTGDISIAGSGPNHVAADVGGVGTLGKKRLEFLAEALLLGLGLLQQALVFLKVGVDFLNQGVNLALAGLKRGLVLGGFFQQGR